MGECAHKERCISPALSPQAAPQPVAQERVFLVCTGETYCGEEPYTRHDGAPPPLCDFETLYTAPMAQERRPLTDEQVLDITHALLKQGESMTDFARAIDRAHGITGNTSEGGAT